MVSVVGKQGHYLGTLASAKKMDWILAKYPPRNGDIRVMGFYFVLHEGRRKKKVRRGKSGAH